MTHEAHVTKICDKDALLNSKINNSASFSVVKSWTSRRYNDKIFSVDKKTYQERQ